MDKCKMQPRILITNLFNTSNHGEMLSLGTVARLVRGSLTVACPYSIGKEEQLPRHMKYVGKRNLNQFSLKYGLHILQNMFHLMREIRRCDAIIDVGGDTISDSDGLFYTLAHCMSLLLAHLFSKPIIVLPQTVEPFRHRFNKSIAKLALNRCSKVFVREPETYRYLRSQGIRADEVTFDPAFYRDQIRRIGPIDASRILIGLNCSKHMYNSGFHCYSDIIDTLRKYSPSLIYIPYVVGDARRSDHVLSVELAQRYGGTIVLADAETTRETISKLTLFIGQRYHAIVSALSACTPTIAVSNAYKTRSLMTQMGLAQYLVDPDKVNFKKRFEETVEAVLADRDIICNKVAKEMTQIRNKVLKMFEEVNACIGVQRQPT